MSQWIYIGLFFVVGLIIPVGAIAAAWVLGPKKPNPIKQTTYECGIETVGDSWVQFKAQYYIFALVFLVFDVETVFLFPWAVRLGQLGLFAVIEGIIFILILIAGLVYTVFIRKDVVKQRYNTGVVINYKKRVCVCCFGLILFIKCLIRLVVIGFKFH